jgi:hypothetical protein
MGDMNASKSAVKRMREYQNKILLLHRFSLSTPDFYGRRKSSAMLDASAIAVGLTLGIVKV